MYNLKVMAFLLFYSREADNGFSWEVSRTPNNATTYILKTFSPVTTAILPGPLATNEPHDGEGEQHIENRDLYIRSVAISSEKNGDDWIITLSHPPHETRPQLVHNQVNLVGPRFFPNRNDNYPLSL